MIPLIPSRELSDTKVRITGGDFEGEEGSIGMLYVKPQYRYQKLATALETYAFNRALENGWIPYGQIIVGNEASMKLQERMGLHFSKSSVYWMANNNITGHTVRCEQ